jgi:hypothetical protein
MTLWRFIKVIIFCHNYISRTILVVHTLFIAEVYSMKQLYLPHVNFSLTEGRLVRLSFPLYITYKGTMNIYVQIFVESNF